MSEPQPLPAPLAELQARLCRAPAGPLRRDRAATLFAAALRFAALVATARYLQLAEKVHRDDASETRIADVLELLGSGKLLPWLDLLHGSLEYLRAHNDELLIPALHTLFFGIRKPAADPIVRVHELLIGVSGESAPTVWTVERMARAFAGLCDEADELPAFLPQADPVILGDALAEAMEQFCTTLAEAVPCIPATMVGHELQPTRVWVRLLVASGRVADELIEIHPEEDQPLPPPGHFVLIGNPGNEPVPLMDLHPLAVLRDSYVRFLDRCDETGALLYGCPSLGISDGVNPVTPRTDLLGRYRVERVLDQRSARVRDLETDETMELALEGPGPSTVSERSETTRALRERIAALGSIAGVQCSTEILEVGRWIVSLRPWVGGPALDEWAAERSALEITVVLARVATLLREVHTTGQAHGQLSASQVVIIDRDRPTLLIHGLNRPSSPVADNRALAELVLSLLPTQPTERFAELGAMAEGLLATEPAPECTLPRTPAQALEALIGQLEQARIRWQQEDTTAAEERQRTLHESGWWQRLKRRLRRRTEVS